MIDPLLPNAIIKTRLLENILEIIKSNDEKFLDISIVCEDGSFLWSQFLLAAASDLFATAMQGVEVTQVIFPDLQVEDVRGSLRGLLCNTSLKTDLLSSTDYSPIINAGDIDSFVKEEIDEEIEFKSDSIMVIHPSNNGEIKMEPSIQQDPRKRTRKQEHTTLDDYEDYEGSYMLELDQPNKSEKNQTNELEDFSCNQCGKILSSRYHLKRHLKTHEINLERPFRCGQCSKTFTEKPSLKRHEIIHTGERPFQCDQCPKAFSDKRTLQKHQILHTGLRAFLCTQCPKTFSEDGGLKRHLKTHSGEKPFLCSHCPKAFSQNSNLTIHLRSHTGEKAFSCHLCPEEFSYNNVLKKHLLTHSKNN